MKLVDLCFNFNNEAFRDDEAAVVERAIEAGVDKMLVVGSDVAESANLSKVTATYTQLMYIAVGVHPHCAKTWDSQSYATLRTLSQDSRVRAIGEAGLDYHRNFSTPEQQRHAFAEQIRLAIETGLPLFLHQREAHEDFIRILAPHVSDLQRVVVHCFTGDRRMLEAYLEIGCYIGITGWICDERRGTHLRDLVSLIPDDRLLVETDAPYLIPRSLDASLRGKSHRNEPAFLPHIVEHIAAARGEEVERTARLSYENSLRFLNLTK